ncbi:MAG: phosphatidate cytidylyltransferase [Zoogloeaceae bacterium]|jgi:phosphatidate cytidylyltransferase|nr:phosphatidate cytidylyltransferase [Zoogloeaceae bacterium]
MTEPWQDGIKKAGVAPGLGMAMFFAAVFFLPQPCWLLCMALVVGVAAWEWAALAGLRNMPGRLVFGLVFLLVCLGLAFYFPEAMQSDPAGASRETLLALHNARWGLGRVFYIPAAIFWILIAPIWIGKQKDARRERTGRETGFLLVLGCFLLLCLWLAFAQLRGYGSSSLVFVVGIAWIAEISACCARRRFGNAIHPGKTRAGLYGATLGASVFFSFLISFRGGFTFSALLFFLVLFFPFAALGMRGDALAAMLKAQGGVKKSGNILPGYGGILDGMDSLLPVLPCVALIVTFSAGYPH